jgi:hypothetical protein
LAISPGPELQLHKQEKVLKLLKQRQGRRRFYGTGRYLGIKVLSIKISSETEINTNDLPVMTCSTAHLQKYMNAISGKRKNIQKQPQIKFQSFQQWKKSQQIIFCQVV